MSFDTDFWADGGTPLTAYTQSAVLQTSQTVAVPAGTRYIEALLCGGGDGGRNDGGGEFGGLMVFALPVLGSSLALVVGAGAPANARGGATTVAINGLIYAACGYGWGGRSENVITRVTRAPLWSARGPDGGTSPGPGAGGGYASPGASMASVTAWGLTGFAGGTTVTNGSGGGGGGMLSAGTNGGLGANGGNGGNGGGGGGARNSAGTTTPGAGGDGFAIFRFYR